MPPELYALNTPQWLMLGLVWTPFLFGGALLFCRFLPKKSLGILSAFMAFAHLLVVAYLTTLETSGVVLRVFLPWFPEALVNFSMRADGLALFFSVLITGMGTLVFFYAYGYMNHEEERIRRFYCYLNIFMGAMLGAVLVDNMMVLFFFWEVTSIMSFLLISYEYDNPIARQSARNVFLINALTSLGLLLGFIFIGVLDQTLELTQIEEMGIVYGKHPLWIFTIVGSILLGIYTKSAQVPFHFWLPQAMEAPTPVSAYLHSATMVKLGIYLTARTYVLFVDSELWFPLVSTLSLVTVLVGGIQALMAKKLKQILAYATISQLGFFISFYGIGDPVGLDYDYVHIFNHALYKGSLFMIVGVLTYSARVTEIHQITGLSKKAPLLALILFISLAAMAGIPGTTGFLSKELLINDLLLFSKSQPLAIVVLLVLLTGLLLKVAFTYRIFYYAFIKKGEKEFTITRAPNRFLLIPPFLLSLTALILGVWPNALKNFYNTFVITGLHSGESGGIYLWHGFSLTLGISFVLLLGGVGFFYFFYKVKKRITADLFPNFAHFWSQLLDYIPIRSEELTRTLHRKDPSQHLAWVMSVFSIGLITFFLFSRPPAPSVDVLSMRNILCLMIAGAVIPLVFLKNLTKKVIVLALIDLLLVFQFTIEAAPNVAMTHTVTGIARLFIILLLFSCLKLKKPITHSWMRGFWAIATGLSVAAIPLFHGALIEKIRMEQFLVEYAQLLGKKSHSAHTILMDFRGLDILGEMAIIVAATLGVAGLTLKRKRLKVHRLPSMTPKPKLVFILPLALFMSATLGVYFLVRSYGSPGGGFVGGLTVALLLSLLGIFTDRGNSSYLKRVNPFVVMMIGLGLSLFTAFISTLGGVSLNFPALFDLGVFLLATGSVLSIIFIFREAIYQT